MADNAWRRALKIAGGWMIALTVGYLLVFTLVRFLLPVGFLAPAVLPTVGVLVVCVSPIALGQFSNSWKVAWLALLAWQVAVPIVLTLVFPVFLNYASPR